MQKSFNRMNCDVRLKSEVHLAFLLWIVASTIIFMVISIPCPLSPSLRLVLCQSCYMAAKTGLLLRYVWKDLLPSPQLPSPWPSALTPKFKVQSFIDNALQGAQLIQKKKRDGKIYIIFFIVHIMKYTTLKHTKKFPKFIYEMDIYISQSTNRVRRSSKEVSVTPRSCWWFIKIWSISVTFSSFSSHRGQGFTPWPWWTNSLVRAWRHLQWRVPKCNAASQSLHQLPPRLTTSTIKGAFSKHFSKLFSLAINRS